MIPLSFQVCIYWMNSVIWPHLLEPFIFSIIVLLFHGSTWSDPYVKGTVSISQHLLHPSICPVFGWFEKKWMTCLFKESHCSPALLKVPIYFTELVAVIFVWKVLCKCTDVLVAISSLVGECVNLQFPNSNYSYSLSVVSFLEQLL